MMLTGNAFQNFKLKFNFKKLRSEFRGSSRAASVHYQCTSHHGEIGPKPISSIFIERLSIDDAKYRKRVLEDRLPLSRATGPFICY